MEWEFSSLPGEEVSALLQDLDLCFSSRFSRSFCSSGWVKYDIPEWTAHRKKNHDLIFINLYSL